MRNHGRVGGIGATVALLAWLAAVVLLPSGPAGAGRSTAGTDFWLAFHPNFAGTPTLTLSITGAAATTGTVHWPDGSSTGFSVTPGATSTVPVAAALATLPAEGTADTGIRVTAAAPVTVYGVNQMFGSSDGYVAVPSNALGTRYRALAHASTLVAYPGRIVVAATRDDTTITVTSREALAGHAAGVPYQIALDAGQVYTATAGAITGPGNEVSGTLVTADKPVAVWAGVDCGGIAGSQCDHQSEQLTPTTAWGTSFLTVRYAKDAGGDPVRVVADADGTRVSVDGSVVATLNAGQFHEATLMTGGGNTGALVTTSKPALVSQFMTNDSYTQGGNSFSGDPSAMLVPPYQQYLDTYTVSTAGNDFGFNAINVAIPTAATASLTLDGAAVAGGAFTPIGATGFSSAQLLVSAGTHTLQASQPFGAFAYGADFFSSYAYAGGADFSAVATVARVRAGAASYSSPVAQQLCIPVTVTNAADAPVEEVPVDLTVAGVNPSATAAATTAADGTASLCYTGASVGADTVTLTAGTESTTVAVTWSPAPPIAPAAPGATAGDGAARVAWATPTDLNGSTITAYTVTASPGGEQCGAAATTFSCLIGGLSNGTAYTFSVVAHSTAGDSPPSPASAAVTPAATPGHTITADRTTVPVGGELVVVATGYQPGSDVTFRILPGPIVIDVGTADADGTATLRATLPPGSAGSYVVRAVGTSAGGQPLSQEVAITVVAGLGGLAITGGGVTLWVFGVLLVLAGIVAVRAAGRSRQPGRRRQPGRAAP